MSRQLYLHEYVDVIGDGAVPYMEHTVGFDAGAAADRALRLLGTWQVVGATGRWPQVVNIWELTDGWDGWRRLCQRTNVARQANPELERWWAEAYRYRSGGFDRLLGAAAGCPTLDQLAAAGVRGAVFVHELSRVHPGAGPAYLAAVREEWAPVAAEYGHHPVGFWEVLLGDTEVCTVWATDLDGHMALGRAGDAGEGADPRVADWRSRAREFCTRWREELMTPGPGTILAAPA